jgi:hypothetical protein
VVVEILSVEVNIYFRCGAGVGRLLTYKFRFNLPCRKRSPPSSQNLELGYYSHEQKEKRVHLRVYIAGPECVDTAEYKTLGPGFPKDRSAEVHHHLHCQASTNHVASADISRHRSDLALPSSRYTKMASYFSRFDSSLISARAVHYLCLRG